jgi:hypothetical protein
VGWQEIAAREVTRSLKAAGFLLFPAAFFCLLFVIGDRHVGMRALTSRPPGCASPLDAGKDFLIFIKRRRPDRDSKAQE